MSINIDSMFGLFATRLKHYKEINKMYKRNYEEREFNDFEKYIFNNPTFTLENGVMNNVENLISLANYYEIYNKNDKLLEILNKLIELNAETGYVKMGNFYTSKQKDYEKSVFYLNVAYRTFNNNNAGLNLAFVYALNNEYNKTKQMFNELMLQKEYRIIYHMSIFSLKNKKYIEWYLYVLLGLKYNDVKCCEIFETLFKDKTKLHKVLLELPFQSDLIKKKLIETKQYYKNVECGDINKDGCIFSPKNISDFIELYIRCKHCENNEQLRSEVDHFLTDCNMVVDIAEIKNIVDFLHE